ncbi:GTPase IMAP family member 9-like isoform X2 [Littorina saxatilis]
MDVRDGDQGHGAGDLVAKGAEAPTHLATDEDDVEFPDHECRIVLVGKTGNGKSSLANTLLGMKRFDARPDFASTTKKCQRYNTVRFGVRLEVVDTPGFFDTELDKETIAQEIAKCFGIIAPGPHAIILVLRVGVRFTKEENKAVDEVYKVFGAHLLRYLVIVFTHGDILERSGEGNMKAMLESAPDKLKELLNRANHRYVVFDNTADEATKGSQVKQLLITVKKLLEVNGGKPFTSETLQIVERCMKGRESELEAEHKGERRRKARPGRREKIEYRFQCRDMARDEVAQEGPLLDTIKTHVLPVLQQVLWRLLTILVQVAMKQGRCTLQ